MIDKSLHDKTLPSSQDQVRPTQTVTYDSVQNHWQMKLKFDQIKYFINKLMFEVFPETVKLSASIKTIFSLCGIRISCMKLLTQNPDPSFT